MNEKSPDAKLSRCIQTSDRNSNPLQSDREANATLHHQDHCRQVKEQLATFPAIIQRWVIVSQYAESKEYTLPIIPHSI